MKRNFLIYSFIMAVIFFILKIILNSFNLDFMYSIYQFSFIIIYITAIIGLFQISKENKILLVIKILFTIIFSFIIIVGMILSSKDVKIVTIKSEKIVTETYGIPDPMINYYKYINSVLKSYNTIKAPTKNLKSENNTNLMEKDIILKYYNKQKSNNYN